MASTAYSGLDRKWLVQTLVIEFLVVDGPILDASLISNRHLLADQGEWNRGCELTGFNWKQ